MAGNPVESSTTPAALRETMSITQSMFRVAAIQMASGPNVAANLQEAGNCYGAAGSNCGDASYFCYNSTPGFVPYPPPCNPGDTQGQPVVPAPTLSRFISI